MMDFVINGNELAAISGLPYIQQLAYIRGIRPYMDVKTGLVGIKRRISYQSLTETLYVEPHQGIQSGSPSRQQLRRVIKSLYNPIERFWHWLKQKVYGCKSFTKMEELIMQIRKLIWHFHEGRTVSKINFNYEAYADLL